MEGLIEEGAELMEEEGDPEVLDAGLIVAAQKVEHYEIAGYGSVCTFAKMLGDKEGLKLLKQTIEEEESTDKKLTSLGTSVINLEAAK
jgi:ferritin-like metal-binding protein YciE